MKDILQKSLKLYGTQIVATFMCFMLVITFNMIGTAFLTKEIGYTVYGVLENEEDQTELYTHYFKDGEDLKKQEYIDKGYTLNEVSVRSQVQGKSGLIWDIVTEIFVLVLMGVFVYNNLWNVGYKDYGFVRRNQAEEDKLKGLKIGTIATLPSVVLLTVLYIGRFTFAKNVSFALFAFLNSHLYEAIILITNGGGRFCELQLWQLVVFYALLLIVPLIAHVGYTLGYKSIIISEKIIYKKKQEF